MGTLHYGDNLDILKRYLKGETIDLVYLDPPFNSAQNYNAFFQGKKRQRRHQSASRLGGHLALGHRG